MKIKNILMLLTLFLVGSILCTACGDDDDSVPGFNVSGLKVTAANLLFDKNGGEQTFYAQTPAQPSFQSDQNWCTLTGGQTSANLKVTPIVVKVEPMNNELTDRTATITVTAGGETRTVSVTQAAGDRIILDKTQVTVSGNGESFSVTVTSNGNYTVSTDCNWITETGSNAGAHTFRAAFNPVGERVGTITFTLNQEKATVTVTQSAGEAGNITATASDIARLMYPGWNLGNTLEGGSSDNLYKNVGISTETAWQSTKTTQAIIDFVKQQGVKSVRIPTAWVMGHITNEAEMTIDGEWMKRVKEVVDYCISDGLYVILNDHWDGGWLENSFGDISDATVTANADKLKKIWTQIANAFRDYDEHLLFAGLNEPGMNGSGFNSNSIKALYKYEQAFIDAVRATGGNNDKRILIVQGPETDITQTNNLYDVTQLSDPAGSGQLMVEVHYYTPWTFCGLEEDASWGKVMYYWGEGNQPADGQRYYANGESELINNFKKMYDKFASKGYPVIVGECGANYRMANDDLHNASIKAWYKAVAQYAISYGCIPFYWDTNHTGYPNMTVFNRATLKVNNSFMLEGINEGVAAATYPF